MQIKLDKVVSLLHYFRFGFRVEIFDKILTKDFSGNGKVEISRFKGLGEMPPNQLKETTMNPEKRSLIQVILPTLLSIKNEDKEEAKITAQLVEHLMGRKPEKRFNYIQQNAQFVSDVDI